MLDWVKLGGINEWVDDVVEIAEGHCKEERVVARRIFTTGVTAYRHDEQRCVGNEVQNSR